MSQLLLQRRLLRSYFVDRIHGNQNPHALRRWTREGEQVENPWKCWAACVQPAGGATAPASKRQQLQCGGCGGDEEGLTTGAAVVLTRKGGRRKILEIPTTRILSSVP